MQMAIKLNSEYWRNAEWCGWVEGVVRTTDWLESTFINSISLLCPQKRNMNKNQEATAVYDSVEMLYTLQGVYEVVQLRNLLDLVKNYFLKIWNKIKCRATKSTIKYIKYKVNHFVWCLTHFKLKSCYLHERVYQNGKETIRMQARAKYSIEI